MYTINIKIIFRIEITNHDLPSLKCLTDSRRDFLEFSNVIIFIFNNILNVIEALKPNISLLKNLFEKLATNCTKVTAREQLKTRLYSPIKIFNKITYSFLPLFPIKFVNFTLL